MTRIRKILLKYGLLLTVFVIGSIIGLLLWSTIELPFQNPWEIVGELAAIHYSPTNNIIRFVVLIALPVVLLLAIYLLNIKQFNEFLFSSGENARSFNYTISLSSTKRILLAISLIIFSLIVAVTVPTTVASGAFDTFHEGESLGPAMSYINGKIPYKDFLFWHGVFHDPLRSVIAFNLFGKSIGSVRAFTSMLKVLEIVLLSLLLRKIYGGNYLFVFLTFIALIIFFNLISALYIPYVRKVGSRDTVTFFFLLTIPWIQDFITSKQHKIDVKKLFIANFFFSFIALASFSYSIDRGFYIFATYLILSPLIYCCFIHKHSVRVYYLLSSLLGLLSALLLLGFLLHGNFSEFLKFTFLIVPQYKDLLDGKVYPIKTLPGLTACMLIAANTYWVAFKFLQVLHLHNKKVMPSIVAFMEKYFIEFCLLLLSIFFFRGALGRSEAGHIVYNSYLPYILFSYIVIKHYLNTILQRPACKAVCSYAVTIVIIFFSSVCIYHIYHAHLIAHNFPLRTEDSAFIPNNYKATIVFLRNNLDNDEDFFTLTSEGCWYYFIDKPCPTRFPVVGFAATKFYQHEIVEDLKKSNVKFILYRNANWTNNFFGFTAEVRQPIIVDYIKQHYTFFKKIDDNEIWINTQAFKKGAHGAV